jgi:hypothetical protein
MDPASGRDPALSRFSPGLCPFLSTGLTSKKIDIHSQSILMEPFPGLCRGPFPGFRTGACLPASGTRRVVKILEGRHDRSKRSAGGLRTIRLKSRPGRIRTPGSSHLFTCPPVSDCLSFHPKPAQRSPSCDRLAGKTGSCPEFRRMNPPSLATGRPAHTNPEFP